jgi:membrane peptidoglycan carboxypeptidase
LRIRWSRTPAFYGLSIGLGGAEVQLLEHTNAYATLANNGNHVDVHPILSIEDSQGNELFNLDADQIAKDSNQAIPAGNAYQVSSILTDNEARSIVFGPENRFGNTQQQLGRPVAAKSGTTDEWKDLWTMGYTTDVAIGVWVGVSGGAPNTGLEAIDGIQAAGPIWQNMMYEVHNSDFAPLLIGPSGSALPEEFPVPDDAYEGEICAVTGSSRVPGKPMRNGCARARARIVRARTWENVNATSWTTPSPPPAAGTRGGQGMPWTGSHGTPAQSVSEAFQYPTMARRRTQRGLR